MDRIIILALFIAVGIFGWQRARRLGDPFHYILPGVWFLLGLNQFIRSRYVTIAALAGLALYFLGLFLRRNRRIRPEKSANPALESADTTAHPRSDGTLR